LTVSFFSDILLIVKGGAYGNFSSFQKKLRPDSNTAGDMPQEEKNSESHPHSSTDGGISEETQECESPHRTSADNNGIEDGLGADEI
jgi:hypothetical protein